MIRAANRPLLAYFEAIRNLRLRQVALVLKAGYEPNLLVNGRGQNGLQCLIHHFGTTEAHFRLQAPINKATYLSIARLLLDSGLDPNSVDILTGESAIFDAIRYHDKDMVALLLSYADLELRNKDGETALMSAARFGSKQVCRLILDHLRVLELDGYFLRQRNRYGLTALELARAENPDCAKLIAKHLVNLGQLSAGAAGLTRSSSHHQLACGPPSGSGVRMKHPAAAAAAVLAGRSGQLVHHRSDLVVADSASELDDDYATFALAAHRARPLAARYDPRAAAFNQYLLEQHRPEPEQLPVGGQSRRRRQSQVATESYQLGGGVGSQSMMTNRRGVTNTVVVNDDDDDDQDQDQESDDVGGGGLNGYYSLGSGQLTRSRSCILNTAGGKASGSKGDTSGGAPSRN